MSFKVQEIVDSHTIMVAPHWQWKDVSGDIVKIVGYEDPTPQAAEFATLKLKTLLNEQEIELKNPQEFSHLAIYCEVYLNGVNISQYFEDLND